jgi:hypothetical protein
VFNILIEFGVPMKLITLVKIYLNETYNGVNIGNYLCDTFLIENGLKEDASTLLISTLLYNMPL